jgi:predicted nuclease of predicted toxin-antitoxin system
MRFLADYNIVAQAVRAQRNAGHDVVYLGERAADPGDQALLVEAVASGRIVITKDHDIGVLVHRDRQAHCGVLLLDHLGDAAAEAGLIPATLSSHGDRLTTRAFLRAGQGRPSLDPALQQLVGRCHRHQGPDLLGIRAKVLGDDLC